MPDQKTHHLPLALPVSLPQHTGLRGYEPDISLNITWYGSGHSRDCVLSSADLIAAMDYPDGLITKGNLI